MANPHGNLAGFSDRGREGWQERVLARADRTRTRETSGMVPLATRATYPSSAALSSLILRAAQARGLLPGHYVRRAVIAFVAHDLGMDLAEVASTTTKPLGFLPHTPARRAAVDDGEGFGLWRIHHLE